MKATLTNGDQFTNGTIGEGVLAIGICLCTLDMCGGKISTHGGIIRFVEIHGQAIAKQTLQVFVTR